MRKFWKREGCKNELSLDKDPRGSFLTSSSGVLLSFKYKGAVRHILQMGRIQESIQKYQPSLLPWMLIPCSLVLQATYTDAGSSCVPEVGLQP
jgi:hypothetical protein